MGQFCELERDVVFTVEYSVRSAKLAVQAMASGPRPPEVVRTDCSPVALARAAWTLLTG
jgi:oleate hydratase